MSRGSNPRPPGHGSEVNNGKNNGTLLESFRSLLQSLKLKLISADDASLSALQIFVADFHHFHLCLIINIYKPIVTVVEKKENLNYSLLLAVSHKTKTNNSIFFFFFFKASKTVSSRP